MSRRPILLVGDVGVGKTTFINNLIKVEAEGIVKDAISLVIDLGSRAVLSKDLKSAVTDEIYRQLEEEYDIDVNADRFVRAVYGSELEKCKSGIYKPYYDKNDPRIVDIEVKFLEEKMSDREHYLQKVLLHLSRGRSKQVVIFIDNCDQRDDETQQLAFLVAQEIATVGLATVFVSLRPETFHRSVREGALSGYHAKVFTISPPRISEVIQKRLKFAQKITRGEIPVSKLGEATVKLKKLDILIEVLMNSFDRNVELLKFVDNISNGNIRQAINLVKSFLGSGHVDTEKIIKIQETKEEKGYIIPLHEFLRAVIYGDHIYYNDNSSPIANIFNVSSLDKREHFLIPILLAFLLSQLIARKNNGYIEKIKVVQQLQAIGFNEDQIQKSIVSAFQKKLIENSSRSNSATSIRITTVGIYHVRLLCAMFQYFDAIVVDTPILDDGVRSLIVDAASLEERLSRVEIFKDYLDKSWQLFDGESVFFNWADISSKLTLELDSIQVKNKKRYEQEQTSSQEKKMSWTGIFKKT
ncbi:MAG: hypothetical protein HGB26_04060 [Desulfobulbaceae bacterium]|nr:hypothetical protein [Desulfobulbaceae bacterium]